MPGLMDVPPEQLLPMVTSMVAGFLMTRSGLQTRLLKLRRAARRCPSCDRRIEGRICRNCAG